MLKNFSRYYNVTAMMFFNACFFFIVLNVFSFIAIEIKDYIFDTDKSNPVTERYGNQLFKKVYPHLSKESINVLLKETWSRSYSFEPFTMFRESPYKGRYVNVDRNGFRITKDQGAWPPNPENLNIFMFGGSGTFGYGVPDDQTIASYLQKYLTKRFEYKIRVYNFGMGSYYSQQERILFEQLLLSGFVPDLVIFIDGSNEVYHIDGRPAFSDLFEQFFLIKEQKQNTASVASDLIDRLPFIRLVMSLKNRIEKFHGQKNDINQSDKIDDEIQVNQDKWDQNEYSKIVDAINRYLENKKIIEAIANDYDVKTVFVWQPVFAYKYDSKYHLFGKPGLIDIYLKNVYQYMEELIGKISLGNNFLWAADIQVNLKRPLYVDKSHYSAEMCDILAVHIGKHLLDKKLLMEKR